MFWGQTQAWERTQKFLRFDTIPWHIINDKRLRKFHLRLPTDDLAKIGYTKILGEFGIKGDLQRFSMGKTLFFQSSQISC